jgi:hypothetical protein
MQIKLTEMAETVLLIRQKDATDAKKAAELSAASEGQEGETSIRYGQQNIDGISSHPRHGRVRKTEWNRLTLHIFTLIFRCQDHLFKSVSDTN